MPETESKWSSPLRRKVIKDAAVPFVARGGRIFSRQVINSDPGIEDREVVLVTDGNNRPLNPVQVYITS
jgi:archaeosine-15-forming tRNA-guanine transglycosylase